MTFGFDWGRAMHCPECRKEMVQIYTGYIGGQGTIVGCVACDIAYRQINAVTHTANGIDDRIPKMQPSRLTFRDWQQVLRGGAT